ncbi:MAG: orotidine-5'-phosphate decarboxylase [Burkholderiaceae bacterium]
MSFVSSLRAAWRHSGSLLCVGLDPDPARLPRHLSGRPDAILEFCRAIADATAPYACAFKPQIAYFAACRAEDQLEALMAHLRERHPGVPVILDAKRGDIGSTAEQYAREVFERYRADAVTVSPYMGFDSIEPYLAYAGRGVILLCRTSNPGGGDLQALEVRAPDAAGGVERVYERVARLAAGPWNRGGELGLVVGATFPAELRRVRELAADLPLLVPGIGAQGGDVDASVDAGATADGTGMMVNSSRAILYASGDEHFARAAAEAARATRDALRAAVSRHRPARAG